MGNGEDMVIHKLKESIVRSCERRGYEPREWEDVYCSIHKRWILIMPQWGFSNPEKVNIHPLLKPATEIITDDNITLIGPTGTGKTIAATMAVVLEFCRRIDMDLSLTVLWWTTASEIERARRSTSLGTGEAEIVAQSINCDILVIDDLGQEQPRGDTALFDIYNARYDKGKKTITTSGLTPDELSARYGAAFIRRMNRDNTALVCNAFRSQHVTSEWSSFDKSIGYRR
jgi:DNA replication protein DnaC